MKTLIIRGNGTIGKKVSSYFNKDNNTVLIAGRTSGDITDGNSITQMFEKTGKLDAII